MVDTDDLEVFKIGRMRIVFPSDITEDEFQFMAMIMYSYIQTVKYKGLHPNIWNRLEKVDRRKVSDAGVT